MDDLEYITSGAEIKCTNGQMPGLFQSTSIKYTTIDSLKPANHFDKIPIINIPSFGICKVTQKPCLPAPIEWIDTWPALIGSGNSLIGKSTCSCSIGGNISFITSGQLLLAGNFPVLACFPENTIVQTKRGRVCISDINIGEEIWAYNEKDNSVSLTRVNNVMKRKTDYFIKLIFDNGIFIEVTHEHPFYTGNKWVLAKMLQKGDTLFNIDSQEVVILDIETVIKPDCIPVYNLEIEGFHNYFISENSILVHNSCEILAPPGDCTPEQHAALQGLVHVLCDEQGSLTCKGNDPCATLLVKIAKVQACINQRKLVMKTCYRGGDATHKQQVNDRENGLKKCERFYLKNCQPKPEPVPVPKTVPAPDPDFMDKMAKITGLTGTALIIYLIISEGSRFFPPRNLIPIL